MLSVAGGVPDAGGGAYSAGNAPFLYQLFLVLLYSSEHDEKQNTVSCVVLSEDPSSNPRIHISHQPVTQVRGEYKTSDAHKNMHKHNLKCF